MKKERSRSRDEAEAEEVATGYEDDDGGEDLRRRAQVQQFFRKLDRTQEWAENHYWHRTWDDMGPDLVAPNAFWNDYAKHLAAHPVARLFGVEAGFIQVETIGAGDIAIRPRRFDQDRMERLDAAGRAFAGDDGLVHVHYDFAESARGVSFGPLKMAHRGAPAQYHKKAQGRAAREKFDTVLTAR